MAFVARLETGPPRRLPTGTTWRNRRSPTPSQRGRGRLSSRRPVREASSPHEWLGRLLRARGGGRCDAWHHGDAPETRSAPERLGMTRPSLRAEVRSGRMKRSKKTAAKNSLSPTMKSRSEGLGRGEWAHPRREGCRQRRWLARRRRGQERVRQPDGPGVSVPKIRVDAALGHGSESKTELRWLSFCHPSPPSTCGSNVLDAGAACLGGVSGNHAGQSHVSIACARLLMGWREIAKISRAARTRPKEHPGLKAELAARAFVARTIVKLGLNVEPLHASAGRPSAGWKGGWAPTAARARGRSGSR